MTKPVIPSPLIFVLAKLGITWGPSIPGTPAEVIAGHQLQAQIHAWRGRVAAMGYRRVKERRSLAERGYTR